MYSTTAWLYDTINQIHGIDAAQQMLKENVPAKKVSRVFALEGHVLFSLKQVSLSKYPSESNH